MLPSSTKDVEFCCNRSTCKKFNQRRDETPLPSSSIEDVHDKITLIKVHKATQNSPMTTSSSEKNDVPAKTSEKSSEANFDRNNQNISHSLNNYSPSYTAQETAGCMVMLKLPSPVAFGTTDIKTFNYCQPPQSAFRSRPKCSCKHLNITSTSSTSTLTSEYFPLNLNPFSVETIMSLPKPERLQPAAFNSAYTSYHEQFYSCSSEDSENAEDKTATTYNSYMPSTSHQNVGVTPSQLLEVVTLFSNTNAIGAEDMPHNNASVSNLDSKLDYKCSKCGKLATTQDPEVKEKVEQKVSRSTSITQLNPLVWPHPPHLCCACRMAATQVPYYNFPLIQPYNLRFPTAADLQTPTITADEETEKSFNDCSSGTKSELLNPVSGDLFSHVVLSARREALVLSAKSQGEISIDQSVNSSTIEEYVDEELHPRYVDNIFIEAFGVYIPNSYSLLEYEDEEPTFVEAIKNSDQEPHSAYEELKEYDPVTIYEPCRDCLMEYDDEEPNYPDVLTNHPETLDESLAQLVKSKDREGTELHNEKSSADLEKSSQLAAKETITKYDSSEETNNDISEQPSLTKEQNYSHIDEVIEPAEISESHTEDLPETAVNEDTTVQEITADTNEQPSLTKGQNYTHIDEVIEPAEISESQTEDLPETAVKDDTTVQEITADTNEQPSLPKEEIFVPSLPTSEVEIGNTDEYSEFIALNEMEEDKEFGKHGEESECLEEEDYELAKEIKAASFKLQKPTALKEEPTNNLMLAALKRPEREGSSNDMKLFIDSLIVDLDAMEFARRKSEFDKNICKPKLGTGRRDSFPVTIVEVKSLGTSSLYVKWIIHDCFGIAGYEVYTDGYLTNRYYSSRHEAAVITRVDITVPHKVAVVAQSHTDDKSIELICNMAEDKKRPKSVLWQADLQDQRNSYETFWTPSIFLYDPSAYA